MPDMLVLDSVGQGGQEISYALCSKEEVRGKLKKRHKDKSTLSHTWMRHVQMR